MTHDEYLAGRYTKTRWFMVAVDCYRDDENEELVARFRDDRFDAYRSEDGNNIYLQKGFTGASEAASWIAEVAVRLKISPYPDRWPMSGVGWGEYVQHGREYWKNKPYYRSFDFY